MTPAVIITWTIYYWTISVSIQTFLGLIDSLFFVNICSALNMLGLQSALHAMMFFLLIHKFIIT